MAKSRMSKACSVFWQVSYLKKMVIYLVNIYIDGFSVLPEYMEQIVENALQYWRSVKISLASHKNLCFICVSRDTS